MNMRTISFFIILMSAMLSPSLANSYSKWCGYKGAPDMKFYADNATYNYIKDHTTRSGINYICYVYLDATDKFNMQNLLGTVGNSTSIELAEKQLKLEPMARNTLKVLKHFRKYKKAHTVGQVLRVLGMYTKS